MFLILQKQWQTKNIFVFNLTVFCKELPRLSVIFSVQRLFFRQDLFNSPPAALFPWFFSLLCAKKNDVTVSVFKLPTATTAEKRKNWKAVLDGKAKVVKRTPFTIQLKYATGEAKQEVTLGVDAGSKTVGLSATTKTEELYASETILRNDIVDLLATRSQYRSARRSRKTRYRKPRFNNRKKEKGWIAPSVRNKINTHLEVITEV